jgi:hypothetical protein
MIAYLKTKAAAFWDRVCWNAWNHARKRELARRVRLSRTPDVDTSDLTPDQRRIYANEARQVLENKHFLEAFGAVESYLEAQAQSCDVDSKHGKDKAARIIVGKQLLIAVRRELERKLNDGYMAEVELVEIERSKKRLRFVR